MMVGATIHAETVCHEPFTTREGYDAVKGWPRGLASVTQRKSSCYSLAA